MLSELESSLLELNEDRVNLDVVDKAFRALHTIKGSGAMFGFDDIAGFVHNLETAFDFLRSGELTATAELISLTLSAGDQIRSMLDAAAGNGSVDQTKSAAILAELSRLTGSPAVSPSTPESVPQPTETAASSALQKWKIYFRPRQHVLSNGTNPLLLLRELRTLGELKVELDSSKIPLLDELDPERCYVAWNMVLETASDHDAILDVFIFVQGECVLTIDLAKEQASETPAANALTGPNPAEPRSSGAEVGSSNIRVSVDKLDQLVNLVGELVTVQARLAEIAGHYDNSDILGVSEAVDRLTIALRENSMSIRMLPLRTTLQRFRRLVHDLSDELGKEVDLVIEGADTELDKTVIDQLNDPLVHLIRNSMDHGIETPEVRRAAGKSSVGTIRIAARQSGASVQITISDDGGGLDVEAVRSRAIQRGLIHDDAHLTEAETFSLIMTPGFSTAAAVTALSGRGVGMDVVRRNIEGLRGSVDIASRLGAGMTVTLRLPLTLAIIDGLLVRVGDTHFVLPLANSLECVELTREEIEAARGKHIANVRGTIIPYIRLSEYFEMDTPRPDREQIMIVETEHGHYGFVVDQVLGDHQTVIKSLGRLYRNVQVVSGATILGNGTVALIIDPSRVVQNVIQAASLKKRNQRPRVRSNKIVNSQESIQPNAFVRKGN